MDYINPLLEHSQALVVVLIIVLMLFANQRIVSYVGSIGAKKHIATSRIKYVQQCLRGALWLMGLLGCVFVIGIKVEQLAFFLSSMFAVIGVALFAQWSILSNITASVIVFFFFPYRVGDTVSIVDTEKTALNGSIEEISLFHVILRHEDGTILTYPNSMVFQKPVHIVPQNDRLKKAKVVRRTLPKRQGN